MSAFYDFEKALGLSKEVKTSWSKHDRILIKHNVFRNNAMHRIIIYTMHALFKQYFTGNYFKLFYIIYIKRDIHEL